MDDEPDGYKTTRKKVVKTITTTTYTTEDLGDNKYKLTVTAPVGEMVYMSSKYNNSFHINLRFYNQIHLNI